MMRQAIRGLVLFGLLAAVVSSTVRAQNLPDVVTVRDRSSGTTKTVSGQYTLSPAGFQIIGGDKKVLATVNPDDVLKVAIGDLPGIERDSILALIAKEGKKEYQEARAGYQDLLKKSAAAPANTKRYLQFKMAALSNKMADELDPEKGWKEKSEAVVVEWRGFLQDHAAGWELWPAVRSSTRVQIELGKFDTAATTWGKLAANKEIPPEAKLEAQLQEIDLNIRGKVYPNAAVTAGELVKTAVGARKERLAIYEIAAKAGSNEKPLEAIDKIKAEMEKSKDPSVHATGYSMLGELYLAGGKPREAMWSFLWVETVLNQDRDEVFKAVVRLAQLFEKDLMDSDQAAKYRDKLKRTRTSF
jgi:hypothetical protein